jgi:hypothetical protein
LRRQIGAFIAITLVTAVPIGCGGGDDPSADERQIRSVVQEFAVSIVRGDYEQVCALVTPEVRADWRRFARRNPDHFSTTGCPAFAKDFYGRDARSQRKLAREVKGLELSDVRIVGDTAIARQNRSTEKTFLEKLNGRWLLTTKEVYADSDDAGKVAERWADAHVRRGEEIWLGACSEGGAEPLLDEFACSIEFRPGGRWQDQRQFTVFLRTMNDHRDVKIVKVLKGSYPGASVPE